MKASSYITRLRSSASIDSDVVGGKAKNLITLIDAGFNVPDGFVITTDAIQLIFDHNDGRNSLKMHLGQINYNESESILKSSERIQQEIDGWKIPSDLAGEIENACRKLGSDLVAVRSSCTAEDLLDASFAGQYDTYLNIQGVDEVLKHVKLCYASLWSPRALTYRKKMRIDEDAVKLAVLVQSMVAAQRAGVLFTKNPVGDVENEILIESSLGLGEAVVSGEVNPDRYLVSIGEKDSFEIVSREIGDRASNILETEGAILRDDEAIALARLGKSVEALYNEPQDIEWAIDSDNQIFLLQTRPITTASDKKSDDILWSRGYSDDYWNDNVTPLFFDLLGDHLTHIVNIELNDIMGYDKMDRNLLKLHKAHVYFNLSVIRNKVINEIPPFLRTDDVLFYFPEGAGAYGKESMRGLPFALKKRIQAEIRVMLMDPNGSMSKTADVYDEWTERDFVPFCKDVDRRLNESNTASELLELSREMDKVMMSHFRLVRYGIPVHNLGMNLATSYLLNTFFGEEEAKTLYPILISGLDHRTTQTNMKVSELAEIAYRIPSVKQTILETERMKVLEILNALSNPEANEFKDAITEFLEEYGVRGHTREPYYQRWGEAPEYVFDVLKALLVERGESKGIDTLKVRNNTELEVEQKLKKQRLGGVKWSLLSTILNTARRYIVFRENQRFNLDRWITRLRAIYLQIGDHFVKDGIISNADQVFFFHKREIRAIVNGQFSAAEKETLSQKVVERYEEFKRYEDMTPPKFIQSGREFDDPLPLSTIEDEFSGVPASKGLATGPIRVLSSIDEIPEIKAGEVIVVPRTDPGWTPVFSKIGGLVTETGGVLSHGAVVSREYGIPAVTNIRNACKTFKTGQVVTLDGSKGIVSIHQKE